ncbi:antibiotic biosynthesis monooxygenase [Mycolicibacterium cyprinidarum]|uniref:Antibiotic biosynthesis monooxygenase n=1 Tax=Mycolicibacterium cyprinidarum TaxID=2860311 RepID=A0ABQ4V567_9MYCO|nr:antibiotic biosynthesis monooxygenase [Mycolicibacterium sp. NGTWSNA01]GJF11085.1 antibiotic biosynthesis monooxygenase [Mycolicibacterium sp. NGTWS0302]
MDRAIVVMVFHRVPDVVAFGAWVSQLRRIALEAEGCRTMLDSVHGDPIFDFAVAAFFSDEELLHQWLDGDALAAALRDGEARGFLRSTQDLVLIPDRELPSGVAAFRLSVTPAKDPLFLAAQQRIATTLSNFAGWQGAALFAPDTTDEWLTLIRFRTDRQLNDWLSSPARAEALPDLRSLLTRDVSEMTSINTFGTTVRTQDNTTQVTPKWKSSLLVLLLLYPIAMVLTLILNPLFNRVQAPPWLTVSVSQILSVAILTWLLMPFTARRFRRWLDPVHGAGWRIGLAGTAAVIALYMIHLTLFATVPWLQYWDRAG